ncbi:MAG: hypothetical protein DLM73_00465 [Chthoniobacterales bacterium]|nr:MAG: hypothetical protein DLM73_00465 [Chthoniobacterales bacterium]
MPRILIAGCGYVGEAAANLFHQRGWEVEGWTASAESAEKLATRPYPVRAVDLGNIAPQRAAFDVVLQCASSGGGDAAEYRRLYLEGARNLIQFFPKATFFFTSSTSVYPQTGGAMVDECSPAEPTHEKGIILRAAEDLVLAHGGVVLRLGGIYGPGRSFFLSNFLSGAAVIGPEDRIINQVHRDDIVSAVLLLAERRVECQGEVFNLVDDQPITAREAYGWLSMRLKKPMPPPGIPAAPRKRGESNKRVSNKKLRALGWQPCYPSFSVAMVESILPSFGF